MKVVALVSGGKDSCYAMMRCLDYGHEIVALANLFPMDDSLDELDSFMYQTVGHQIVVAYAQCMGLPLYRRRIRGQSRAQDLRYALTVGDEVEDLFLLLKEVKEHFPGIQGVSCGAIASDYQRMRVENVCSRLGLVSLAFLWKQDQATLLQQMIESKIDAILVKVAAIGLKPHDHLGKTLAEMQPLLNHLHSLYGSNVCGEGGEYETLTLDCLLFKNCKIVLDDYDILLHSLDNIAPVGVLHPSKFHLECKAPDMASEVNQVPLVKEVDNSMENCTMQQQNSGGCNPVSIKQLQSIDKLNIHISLRILKGSVSSVCCWIRSCPDTYGIGNELGLVLASISAELEIIDLSWANALYVHLYVHDMGAFALANETYVQYITEELCVKGVPSRSTVGLALKESNLGRVMVEVLIAKDMNKKVLHVQSISCWAPSCIGPYSQATLHNGFLYMAGQLGLDPPTMALVNGGAGSEFKQALQNSEAIAQAFSTSLSTSPISILLYCSPIVGMSEREETETILHNFLRQYDQGADLLSYVPVLYVQVSALPKGANVEIEPFLYVPDQSGSCDYEGILLQRVSSSAKACQASIVRECLCRAFFSIAKNISGHTAEALPDIKTGLRTSLQDFSQMLVNTGLCWEHVLALRILFVADLISMEFLFEGWQHAVMQFCEISVQEAVPLSNMSALCSLKPLFLPVLGTGLTPSMEDVITLDLLAVSQPPNH